jgi:hypothetical protein
MALEVNRRSGHQGRELSPANEGRNYHTEGQTKHDAFHLQRS